jgi:hypothetical protein
VHRTANFVFCVLGCSLGLELNSFAGYKQARTAAEITKKRGIYDCPNTDNIGLEHVRNNVVFQLQ